MDRFIVADTGEVDEATLILKSNMDRFIDLLEYCDFMDYLILKSNMDRFIDDCGRLNFDCRSVLKSNMDRFIAFVFMYCICLYCFKIQYG